MAQSPYKVDVLQIEPAAAGTRTISRDATDGSLKFIDAAITAGLTLSQLSGIRNITGIFVVGRAGSGAPHTAIQDALDAIPDASDADAPSLILVGPGLYTENLTIDHDGVYIIGLGGVVLRNTGVADTITILEGVTTTPLRVRLQNLRIENDEDGKVCVHVVGDDGSTVGSDLISIIDCEIVASGVGTYQIMVDTANNVSVQGGTWAGSSSSSVCFVVQCASFSVENVAWANDFDMAYDDSLDKPSVVGSAYTLSNVGRMRDINANLVGAGSVTTKYCPDMTGITVAGDQTFSASFCRMLALSIGGTIVAALRQCIRSAAAGVGTLSESSYTASAVLNAEASKAIVFDMKHPDTTYTVLLETDQNVTLRPTGKLTTGFTITASMAMTGTVYYTVLRQMS